MAQLEHGKATAPREQLVYFVVEAEAAVVAAATTPNPLLAAPAAGELYLQEDPAVAARVDDLSRRGGPLAEILGRA